MRPELKQQIDEFRSKTAQFAAGEMSVKDYKGFSGKFGSYAQKGAKSSMLRLRITGGRLSVQRLGKVVELCDKYGIDMIHSTTCETFQLHNIPLNMIADVLTDAIEAGFYTLGGGGDFPRNVMVSPLSGVDKDEYFDVAPYAEKAAEYLLTQIDKVKMPRKLKVCFSNSPANAVHATFRDLGFVAGENGTFDVYCAGGMGNNPKMGVKVGTGVKPEKAVYYIKAMIGLFCEYGNYENRAKARTRYMQDVLGDRLPEEFGRYLDAALAEGGLDITVEPDTVVKQGCAYTGASARVIPQKQDGLYAIKYHPAGGVMSFSELRNLYETVSAMSGVSLRISPDETIYIINCDGNEAQTVVDATPEGAVKPIEESVSCIGAAVCQQGLRDSQGLLGEILKAVKPYDFPARALPTLHISGCTSSCGTHQIGLIGFHGKMKMIDKKPQPAFSLHVNGCDKQGEERFGDELGVILTADIPAFIVELGKAVTSSGISCEEFIKTRTDEFAAIVNKYI